MGNPGNASTSAKSGKVYQGGNPPSGSPNPQGVKQGQTASIRPAGMTSVGQPPVGSTTSQGMDYRQAVSPVKPAGGLYTVSHQNQLSSHSTGLLHNYQLGNISYIDPNAYSDYDDAFLDGQTQDVANRRLEWYHQAGAGATPSAGLMDFDGSDSPLDHLQGTRQQQQTGLAASHDRNDQNAEEEVEADPAPGYEHLPNIPEADESESGGEEEETDDTSYIDRNQAWIHVLDENLQKHRKNPAEKTVEADFEMDMGELLTAVDDIIETSNHDGNIPTDTLFLDTKLHNKGPYIRQLTIENGDKDGISASVGYMRFTTRDLKSRAVPVWLELYDVHPGLMKFGINMLRKTGPIIYAAKNAETQRINIIRGCVLMDLSKPLPEFIPISVQEAPDKVMKQHIRYLRLPDACFNCRQRGHFARACPLENARRGPNATGGGNNRHEQNAGGVRTEIQRDGGQEGGKGNQGTGTVGAQSAEVGQGEFTAVRRRTKPRFQTPETKKTLKVDNRYGVLKDPIDTTTGEAGQEEIKRDVRPKPADAKDKEIPYANNQKPKSSSSNKIGNKQGQPPEVSDMLIREVVDLTEGKPEKEAQNGIPPRTAGTKYQPEDRDRRLSSTGAIANGL
ncbi:hypothetical protein R1sor_005907 [Riccia sorocarpa]|uniref:CCHC-type domain-containing protein n=1 Tax=Riccia sorocarpa TaxID=122646 RepID=A0ABD3HN67_9MARC